MNTQQMLKCGPLIKPNFLFSILSNASATSWASSSLGNMTLSTSVSTHHPVFIKMVLQFSTMCSHSFCQSIFPCISWQIWGNLSSFLLKHDLPTVQSFFWKLQFFRSVYSYCVTSIAESRTSVKKKKKNATQITHLPLLDRSASSNLDSHWKVKISTLRS